MHATARLAQLFGQDARDDETPDRARDRGEVAYVGGNPQLPGDLVGLARGSLAGHVFVSENVSIRHLAFRANSDVVDLGSLAFGDGLEQIAGAIGVIHTNAAARRELTVVGTMRRVRLYLLVCLFAPLGSPCGAFATSAGAAMGASTPATAARAGTVALPAPG